MSTFAIQLFSLLLPFFLCLSFFFKWLSNSTNNKTKKNTPPSPPKLPLIGNLHQLGNLSYRSLNTLSQQYGTLILLHFGTTPVLVVSSPDIAREIIKTHDTIFANRPKLRLMNKLFYDGKDIVFGPYGTPYWRQIKSIAVVHLLSNKKVHSYQTIREQEVGFAVEKIKSLSSPSGEGGVVINLSEILLGLVKDIISRACLGKKYSGDFDVLLKEFMEVIGAISVGDFIPWLGWIDRLTGLERKAECVAERFDEFLSKVVCEHRERKMGMDDREEEEQNNTAAKDFVDVLLEIQTENGAGLSTDSIKALILDMFSAATETTFALLEWAMTELIKHPTLMIQLREEVTRAINGKPRVTVNDLESMKLLKAVIKETLRLHPPVPILPFRKPSRDVQLNGYEIEAGTLVFINAWAIQRDPKFWDEPEEFNPGRFLESSVDFKGEQYFQFIPFGGGRRGCPGAMFAMMTTELVLASLVYEFDWKLPGGEDSYQTSDMEEECAGIIVRRKYPLMLIPSPCSSV